MTLQVRIEQKDFVNWRLQRKTALKDINIDFEEGKTTLIMGTSGAGKSTLIKCILGKARFGGTISSSDGGDYKKKIAYIPQYPALNEELTVESTIYWACRFSNPSLKDTEIECMVNKYLEMAKIESSLREKLVRQLSGGQKQRVSIAKELIRGKEILIADEIDTGLDCGVSRALISTLATIAKEEKKVVIIISHNLTNVDLYDNVVVLVKDSNGCGQIAYCGEVNSWHSPSLKSFFQVEDYYEILLKLNARSEGGSGKADYFIKRWKK